jgi:DNA-binding IclR family transcriptional regulator
MSSRETPAISQTLDRGLQVLEAVARAGDPLTVAEAAASVAWTGPSPTG